MVALSVKIQSLEDAANGKELVKGMTLENSEEAQEFTVGVLESGTVSGATSLMFILKTKEGNYVYSQCTAKHLEALAKVVQGAKERFGK